LEAQIADLEARQNKEQAVSSEEATPDNFGDPANRLVSETINELMRQRRELKGEINNIGSDIAKLKLQLKDYQQRVERTPKREQELMTLKRDYENMQESYTSLLNRKLEAEIAVNMEKKQKGEQFGIIDRAVLPHKPVSPDLRRLFMLSIAAGLSLGAGLIILLDFFNTSIKQTKDVEDKFGLTVLASIPKIYHRKDKIKHWINQGLTAFSICIAASLTVGFASIVFKGIEPTLQFVRNFIRL
jgi:capsular polysaccharide biosynthesis protein